jgi:hypothetical protein
MTIKEHALISRCAAIYFLGFLNPTSTGSDFFTLRSSESDSHVVFFEMGLEERLENTSRLFQAQEFGQVDVCTDVNRDRAFVSFLQNGLTPFLSHRAAHPNQTDVLHLLAMSISPQLNTDVVGNIVAPFEEKQLPAWVKTSRLMGCLYPQSFPLHYAHRFLLVKLVSEQLVLPDTDSPHMIAGAVPHLLAAMHTFAAHSARTVEDAHVAHQGLVRIASQTGHEWIVREVFYIILSQTIEDCNCCKCPNFCTHRSRGNLLKECISTFNASRHYADGTFTEQAFVALGASIEEQIAPWQSESDDDPGVDCLLGSLLQAAETLFYFLLESDGVDTSVLLEMVVQLLHHPSSNVCKSASSLLSVAISYMSTADSNKVMKSVLTSIKSSLAAQFKDCSKATFDLDEVHAQSLSDVIAVASCKSFAFGSAILKHLLHERGKNWKSDNKTTDDKIADCTCRLIVTISNANALAAFRVVKQLRALFEKESSKTAKLHLVAALLAIRHAYSFGKDDIDTQAIVSKYLDSNEDRWAAFQLARHSLATGNFSVAKSIYTSLVEHTSSEESYLWISSLSKVAEAESILLEEGAKGVPRAATLVQSAVSYTESLSKGLSMLFQIEFLRLRLDFLDLSATTRLICRETRLSGTVPKDTTRVGLHLVNTLKSWGALAARYRSLYRRHGLFLCNQSRASIRTMHSICREIGRTGMKILDEAVASRHEGDLDTLGPKGCQSHPTIRLMQNITESVLPKMDRFVEPAVRATILSELIEGVHRSPMPMPRGFTSSRTIPPASLRISLDPSQQHTRVAQDDLSMVDLPPIVDSTTIYPGMNLTVFASGCVPKSIAKHASSDFSQLLLWTHIRLVSAEPKNSYVDNEESDSPQVSTADQIQSLAPSEIPLPTAKNFVVPMELPPIKSVGIYRVDYILGCRDTQCGEWELPLDSLSRNTIMIRVSRRLG